MTIKHLLLASTALLAVVACNKEVSEPVQSQFPEDGVMLFTTNLNAPAEVQTRASITNNDLGEYGTKFQAKIVNPASATYSYFKNIENNGMGVWRNDDIDPMLWQNNTAPITVTAAYLKGKTFTDAEFQNGAAITVAADQSTEAKVKAQDLLTMPTKTIANPSTEQTLLSGGKLVINFYHGLTKLDVTLDLANEFYNNTPKLNNATDITDVTISGINLGYTFQPMQTANENYGTVSVTASTAADLQPYQYDFTAGTETSMHSLAKYESIVVPQEIAAGALTVSFKVGTRSFSWTNTQAYTLEQGKLYTLPLTVGYDTVTSAPSAFSASAWAGGTGSNLGTE